MHVGAQLTLMVTRPADIPAEPVAVVAEVVKPVKGAARPVTPILVDDDPSPWRVPVGIEMRRVISAYGEYRSLLGVAPLDLLGAQVCCSRLVCLV